MTRWLDHPIVLSSDLPFASLLCGFHHHLLGALLHLLWRHVFLVRRDAPEMAERVTDKAGAVAIELVLDRSLDFRSLRDGLFDNFVAIGKVGIEAYRRRADALSAAMAHLWIFIGQHDAGVADLQLGVAYLAVGTIHANQNGRPENTFVVFDRFRRSLDDQVRRHGVESLGNVVDFAHDLLLMVLRSRCWFKDEAEV